MLKAVRKHGHVEEKTEKKFRGITKAENVVSSILDSPFFPAVWRG
jgi:hypothetical protein